MSNQQWQFSPETNAKIRAAEDGGKNATNAQWQFSPEDNAEIHALESKSDSYPSSSGGADIHIPWKKIFIFFVVIGAAYNIFPGATNYVIHAIQSFFRWIGW